MHLLRLGIFIFLNIQSGETILVTYRADATISNQVHPFYSSSSFSHQRNHVSFLDSVVMRAFQEVEEKIACICGAAEVDSSADEEWVICEECNT